MKIKPGSLTSALVKIRDDGRWKVLDYTRQKDDSWLIKLMVVEN